MDRPRFSAGIAEKTEYEVAAAKLPESFNGFKIAHISDIHSRPAEGAIEIIAEERPDITVITGDLVHDDDKSVDDVKELLSKILAISPIYMVTGNHDVWRSGNKRIFMEFESLGAQLLEGTYTEVEKNGEKIAFFGIGDPFSRLPQVISEKVKADIQKLPEYDGYKILLFHRANLFDEIKNAGFDLILSGHMHGGQIRLPHLGGVLAPSSAILSKKRMIFPRYCFGEVHSEETTMLINRGMGNTLPVPRLGNRPEVGIVTLTKK